METKRHFTLEEANRTLKEIHGWVVYLTELKESVDAKAPDVEQFREKAVYNVGSPVGTRYVEELINLQNTLGRIQEMAVLVKDLNRGLLDFPHMREGQEVYLCWELGEEAIEYWHEVDAGYAERKKISE